MLCTSWCGAAFQESFSKSHKAQTSSSSVCSREIIRVLLGIIGEVNKGENISKEER